MEKKIDGKDVTAAIVFKWTGKTVDMNLETSPVSVDDLPKDVSLKSYPAVFFAGVCLKAIAENLADTLDNLAEAEAEGRSDA